MSYITPNSTIYLIHSIELDTDYQHTYRFSTPTAQFNFFTGNSKLFMTLSNNQYVRTSTGELKVKITMAEAQKVNYMCFKNPNFENRYYYCFVTGYSYINNTTTLLSYSVDIMQTYMFDYTMGQCLIEREHVSDDRIGKNITPEGFNVNNESTINKVDNIGIPNIGDELIWTLVIFYTCNIKREPTANDSTDSYYGRFMNGEYQGYKFFGVDIEPDTTPVAGDSKYRRFLYNLSHTIWDLFKGSSSSDFNPNGVTIVGATLMPKSLYELAINYDNESEPYYSNLISPVTIQPASILGVDGIISDYTPTNKKLYSDEFWKLYVKSESDVSVNYNIDFIPKDTSTHLKKLTGRALFYLHNMSLYASFIPTNYNNRKILTTTEGGQQVEISGLRKYEDVYASAIKDVQVGVQVAITNDGWLQWLNQYGSAVESKMYSQAIMDSIGVLAQTFGSASSTTSLVENSGNTISDSFRNASTARNMETGRQITMATQTGSNTSVISPSSSTTTTTSSNSGGVLGSFMKMVSNANDSAIQLEQAKNNPSSLSGGSSANILGYRIYLPFEAIWTSIDVDTARRIDNYFTMYGYKVNRLGIPAVFGGVGFRRPSYNYLKLTTVNIKENVGTNPNYLPKDVEIALENIYKNGITFWESNVTIKDYTATNTAPVTD